MDRPWALSATELLAALDRGELSSEEAVRSLLERRDAVDGAVRGWVHRLDDEALEAARRADAARARGERLGPLHGLPLSIKENVATAGLPCTMGIRARLDRPEPEDAAVVAAARAAGAIVLGKTNVPLLLLSFETHNDIWGTTRNPWNPGRVPGGSSGGEAAVIATGQSPAGIGSDIGGSIRIPAAWCGICGLKPTLGRFSMHGVAGAMPGQEVIRATTGPMARTVDDLVLLWRALAGPPQRRWDPSLPPLDPGDPAAVELSGLRVGVYEDDGVFRPAASVRRAVREAAAALADAGAEIVEYAPPAGWEMAELYFAVVSGDGARSVLRDMAGQGFTPQLSLLVRLARTPAPARRAIAAVLRSRGEERVARVLEAFGRKPIDGWWRLAARRGELRRREFAAWDEAGIDLLVGPPTVTPAALHGETGDWSLGAWHTMRYNVLDPPAGVVPVSRVRADETRRQDLRDRLDRKAARLEEGSEGLPLAAQVIGRPWDEPRVLAAMRAIEAVVRGRGDFPRTPVDPRGVPA